MGHSCFFSEQSLRLDLPQTFDLHQKRLPRQGAYSLGEAAELPRPFDRSETVVRRCWLPVGPERTKPEFKSISPESKRAILEILLDTKSDLANCWKTNGTSAIVSASDNNSKSK